MGKAIDMYFTAKTVINERVRDFDECLKICLQCILNYELRNAVVKICGPVTDAQLFCPENGATQHFPATCQWTQIEDIVSTDGTEMQRPSRH